MHALGVKTLIVSNAAGGVNRLWQPGDLMLIRDHINLMFRNPLVGALEPGDIRFPDMSEPYDAELAGLARAVAAEQGIPLREGVYAGLTGPAYETRPRSRCSHPRRRRGRNVHGAGSDRRPRDRHAGARLQLYYESGMWIV